jgi:phthiocerol/phenolphthiocerol synthesis type-I polyketide synthase E
MTMSKKYEGLEIAIIGMSAQFPDSDNFRSFWQNLTAGKEMLTEFTKEELLQRGMPVSELDNQFFVAREGVVRNKDRFDNAFFDYTPHEAAMMDPQIRLMHENCWRALEDAGYASATENVKIGLFAGAADNETWRAYLYTAGDSAVDPLFKTNISRSGFMCTLVSHKLNLRGPSIFVDTACSTSLAAVHLACRSLLTKECTLALAGGVTINTHLNKGYVYQKEGIKSIDGHTRAFDANATGTGGGEGIGMVVLKRLNEAIRDRDHIYAIIKATAANNDGSNKVGYTAPSVKGQADCIKMAHKLGGVEPESISYIETHGTATRLGDVVEIRALNEAFKKNGQPNSCAIGSVKSNIGHCDRAAGIAGVIKAALSIYHKQIPASLFFDAPNPEIDFADGPFYVNASLTPWKVDKPLRAGVSSFGIGGTNVHAVLEEPPVAEAGDGGREFKLLALSARTESSLKNYINELTEFISTNPELDLADMAYTLLAGRKHFEYRKSVEFKNREDLLNILSSGRLNENITKSRKGNSVVFMFSGLGTQYTGMCRELYETEPVLKQELDNCFDLVKRITGLELKAAFTSSNEEVLFRFDIGQYLVFAIEYALAKMLMHWGVKPAAMIGYSFGEYVAACIAGVFSLEDAIKIIHKRGELIQLLPPGGLLSVPLTAKELQPLLSDDISLAIDNGSSCVVSGAEDAVIAFEKKMMQNRLMCVRVRSAHALHSHEMKPVLQDFEQFLGTIKLNVPEIPYISNVTGDWIKTNEPTEPEYWGRHLRHTVQFSKGVEKLVEKDKLVYIEIGPGNEISTLVNRYLETKNDSTRAINIIRPGGSKTSDSKYLLNKLGKLWCMGVSVDWNNYYGAEKRRRVSLPTYAFEPTKYLAEINPFAGLADSLHVSNNQKKEKLTDWFYQIVWKQSSWLPGRSVSYKGKTVLVFGLADEIRTFLSEQGANAIFVSSASDEHIESLFAELYAAGTAPEHVFHGLCFDGNDHHATGYESLLAIARGFNSFFANHNLQINVIGNGWYNLLGNETIIPAKSTALGALKVITQELPHIACRAIEITDVSPALFAELNYAATDKEVAIRGKKRYIKEFEKVNFELAKTPVFKQKGTYLITGATGGMGRTFAKFLAEQYNANLVLISRSAAPTELPNSIYIQSDITDAEKIAQGVQLAEQRFGAIDGVIHTAGLADHYGLILRRSREDDNKILAPKVQGTQVLLDIFKNKPLDFFVNCSSLAASLGPIGHVAYTAGNLYQDACAEAGNTSFPVISIQWTNMKEVGMSMPAVQHMSAAEQEEIFKLSISPADAIEILQAALYLKIPTPVISTTDLHELIRRGAPNATDVESFLENGNLQATEKKERPDLSSDYISPVSATEIKLAHLFANYFGISKIGIEDDFFELGGDSLKAMVLLRRIAKEFSTDISLKDFLTSRNIQGIASLIDEKLWISTPTQKKYSAEI